MELPFNNDNIKITKGVIYFLLVIIGVLIILLCSIMQEVPAPQKGEYFYSTFFRNNYTILAKTLFFTTGLFAGYFFQLNPWYAGICLNLIFPVTSIIESLVYRGSHNLIPIELAFHLWFALPFILAVAIGRFIYRQVEKRKVKVDESITN
jgi:hypothetical protein